MDFRPLPNFDHREKPEMAPLESPVKPEVMEAERVSETKLKDVEEVSEASSEAGEAREEPIRS